VKQLLPATLIALGCLGAGCGSSRPAVVAAGSPANTPLRVAAPQTNEKILFASGPLLVENQVDVAAQREGVIAHISGELGTRVKKGQILAQLDDRQLSADFEAAQAKTRSASADLHNWEAEAKVLDADWRRAEKLWDAGVITKEQLEHTRYKAESDHWDVERAKELVTNAEASERSLELELEKTRIQAPFDGIVARRYARIGQKVDLGDRLFWISAESPLRIRFTLPESFLGHIKKGQQFELTSPDVEGQRRLAKVIEISPVIDPASGTIEVLCEVMGAVGELRPGMNASVRVTDPR